MKTVMDLSPHGATGANLARPATSACECLLLKDLQRVVDPATPGDPMLPLLWTCKSTRDLTEALRD